MALGKSRGEVDVDAHDLARRPHLGTEYDIDAGELGERKNGFLDRHIVRRRLTGDSLVIQRPSHHDPGGNLCQVQTGGLGNKWYRSRSAGVDLEDINLAILDGELNVHQASDLERLGQGIASATSARR